MSTHDIKAAMELAVNRDYEGAMEIFKNGDMVAGHPEAISYYALSISEVYRNHKKGLALCINALKRDVKNPVIYCNLGKLFLKVNEKGRAYKAFDKGLQLSKQSDKECSKEIKELGVRRAPIVGFLKRDNFLNVTLGKFSSRVA
jgi:hypothetical protein